MTMTSGRGMTSTYFFAHKPLSEGLPALPNIFCFLKRGINELTLLCVCRIALSMIMSTSVHFGFSLGMRLRER